MPELESAAPHRVAMTTRLPRAECMARLKAGVGHWMNLFTDKPVRGLVLPSRVLLMSARWFTSHTPVTLTLTESASGTRIDGQAGIAIASIVTVMVLGSIAALAEIAGVLMRAPWWVLAGPMVLLGACALASAWIAMMTQRSHTEILAYVRTLLEATDASPRP